MPSNSTLNKAGRAKKDEFYTRLEEIEQEMWHYEDYFRGKTILCNCDDPFESNFFKYFAMNFNHFGLRKLIATCYDGSPVAGQEISFDDLLAMQDGQRKAFKVELTSVPDINGDGAIDLNDVEALLRSRKTPVTCLSGNGDFRSDECLALMDEADIVVTNPPFSLFREFVSTLMEHHKKFIILGNVNAITYKEVFPLIMENRIWFGVSIHSGDRAFFVPDDYPLNASGCGVDVQGRRFIRVKGVRWWTNLDYKERHEGIDLYKHYTEEEFPQYDNYSAINVNKTADIPADFYGLMGVPITFLDKYSPDQFEIVMLANGNSRTNTAPETLKQVGYIVDDRDKGGLGIVNGSRVYARILIRRKI